MEFNFYTAKKKIPIPGWLVTQRVVVLVLACSLTNQTFTLLLHLDEQRERSGDTCMELCSSQEDQSVARSHMPNLTHTQIYFFNVQKVCKGCQVGAETFRVQTISAHDYGLTWHS